jgi:hypothetical protein
LARFQIAIKRPKDIYGAPHNHCAVPAARQNVRSRKMKMFEAATTMLLAVATQMLAVGVIFG